MNYDIIVIGAGISGLMMMNRIRHYLPEMSAIAIDKTLEVSEHVFHLHRPIPEIPELNNPDYMKSYKFITSVWTEKGLTGSPSIKDINDYAYKCFGKLHISNAGNSKEFTITPVTKQKLVSALSVPAKDKYISKVVEINTKDKIVTTMGSEGEFKIKYKYIVSTIPLPILLSLANIDHSIEFENFPFWNAVIPVGYNTHMYQQVVNTDPGFNWSRLTVFDDEVFIESVKPQLKECDRSTISYILGKDIHHKLSNINMKSVWPGRIGVLPQTVRKPLLYHLTGKHDILCLGRYGAWTYKVANDVWDDCKFLCDLISSKEMGHKYEGREPWNQK